MLDRSFEASAPNRKWIADFTYVWTAEGWLYVTSCDRAENPAGDGTDQSLTVTGSGDSLTFTGSPRKDQKGTFSPHLEVVRAK